MGSYIYWSSEEQVHQLNAARLQLQPVKINFEALTDLDALLGRKSGSYIFSDCLLLCGLNNAHADNTDDIADVEIAVTSQRIDDAPLRAALQRLFNIEVDASLSIVFTKICSSELLQRTKLTHVIRMIPDGFVAPAPLDISRSALTTKAKTLAFFNGLITARIDPGVVITFRDWIKCRGRAIQAVMEMEAPLLIVRSSSLSEDSFSASNAGAFESRAGVNGFDSTIAAQAISAVYDSYTHPVAGDEVLIQRQITTVSMSGVCTTRVIGKGSPYYVICYDEQSGRTDSITSGDTNDVQTLLIYRKAKITGLGLHPNIERLMLAVQQIETIVGNTALDIEFIIDLEGLVNIVQIRPLVGEYDCSLDEAIDKQLHSSLQHYAQYHCTNDGVTVGTKAAFGVMPDANPAELIGIKPKPLAFSLYQSLITNEVVTAQRAEYGYRDVRPIKHMLKFGGSPFINVRSSFNSFTPAAINNDVAGKLIDNYVERLINLPELHDKVEFEIVATCWFPGIDGWFAERYPDKFTAQEKNEIIRCLKSVFIKAVQSLEQQLQAVEAYGNKFDNIIDANCSDLVKGILLIETCRVHGCKPFAHLARSAFVAMSVLRGLVASGYITKEQYNDYLHHIESVSSGMEKDGYQVATGSLDKNTFYERYGHLRPGTYDICSQAYFEDPVLYLDPIIHSAKNHEKSKLAWEHRITDAISLMFAQEGISINFAEFDHFAKLAIHGREDAKFKYTKFMSYGLQYILKWAASLSLDRHSISYLLYSDLQDISTGNVPTDVGKIKELINLRRNNFNIESKIELPDFISEPLDFYRFTKKSGKPNFVTGKAISAESMSIAPASAAAKNDIEGKIVLIESADPGYDWLFGCKIGGLITKYGGANSHMSIRCAELGIPAAIGVGDILFDNLQCTTYIMLDCNNETIKFQ